MMTAICAKLASIAAEEKKQRLSATNQIERISCSVLQSLEPSGRGGFHIETLDPFEIIRVQIIVKDHSGGAERKVVFQ